MLSSVLGSDTAIYMNIRIMRAFTATHQIMEQNAILFQRVFHLEQHQLETDEKIELILSKMDTNSSKLLPEQIFGSHGDRHLGNAAGASPALKEENGKRKSSYRLPFFRLVFEINRLIIWKLQN